MASAHSAQKRTNSSQIDGKGQYRHVTFKRGDYPQGDQYMKNYWLPMGSGSSDLGSCW
jgi:hypothetical protein